MRICLLVGLFALCAAAQTSVASPDGAVQISFVAGDGPLSYSVSFHGKSVIARSALGLDLEDQRPIDGGFHILGSKLGSLDETYSMPFGKSNPIRNQCRTLTLDLEETLTPGRRLTLEARAYNDGVAFRYVLPDQATLKEVRISGERTEFQFAKESTTYPLLLPGFHSPYEDDYHTLPVSGIHPDYLIGLPLLAELPGVAWVAITEADIENYPGMYLIHNGRDARSLFAKLAPSMEEPGIAVQTATPMRSPWRVIMLGAQPGRLVESNIVVNLNPPSAIADASWIKPGKTAWDWWSGTYAEGVDFKPGMNTATMKHYIDFSASSGIEYMLIDAGWAKAGNGPADSGADLTQTNPAIDMTAILAYAKSKKVGVWLWAHWSDIERQVNECFPLFEKWGVAGVKIDFMNRDDQWMVNYYRRIVKKAAEHHLMIDYHGAYKPDGMRRTWPNLITRESVMGAEYNKWSGRITADHNLMLAFTRMLAGPMDYTPGGFNNVTREEFEPRMTKPEVQTTRAHALALYAIFESPFQMVADYPEAYKGQKDFEFIKAAPTVWDETRVIGGKPGDYIAVARRHGREWFVGAITGTQGREVDLPMEFLGRGAFTAEVYADAADAAANPKHTAIEQKRVDASTLLHVKMAPSGGEAIRIRPVE
ncbi:MAG: glycoside hydrolase family 97 protein [Bryobacteraceae bacterium]